MGFFDESDPSQVYNRLYSFIFSKTSLECTKGKVSDRKILICREISKLYEEHIRTNVNQLELFDKLPKGELTVVLSEKDIKKNITASFGVCEYMDINGVDECIHDAHLAMYEAKKSGKNKVC